MTGSFLYDQRTHDFTFRPGPIFTNLLLADEINRTPPKTQAALLEAMQEKQVSVEGVTYRLKPPVPRARHRQPDRVRGHLSAARGPARPVPAAGVVRLPDPAEEWDVLRRRIARRREEAELEPVVDAATLLAMQAALEQVAVEDSVGRYLVELTAATRDHALGAGRRLAARLARAAAARPRARAAMAGRDFVIPEDVKAVAVPALAHRITLRPEMWLRRVDPARSWSARSSTPTPAPASAAMPSYTARRLGGSAGALAAGAAGADLGSGPGGRARRWPGGAAHRRCSCIAGVVLGRVDLVLLAAPFALGTAWALRRRPRLTPQLELSRRRASRWREATSAAWSAPATRTRSPTTLVVLRAAALAAGWSCRQRPAARWCAGAAAARRRPGAGRVGAAAGAGTRSGRPALPCSPADGLLSAAPEHGGARAVPGVSGGRPVPR